MAGKIIADTIEASGSQISLNVGNVTVLTASSSGANITTANIASISGAVVATQANQETATSTSTLVTPGRQQYHPSAAKGWVKATTVGTSAVSFNVSSVTDVATGRVIINWIVPFSSANYVPVAIAQKSTSLSATTTLIAQERSDTTASACHIDIIDSNGTAFQDPTTTNIAAWGDQ